MDSYLKQYINGKWVDSIGGKRHEVISPSTEEPCTEITLGTQADVDAAVAAAKEAFKTAKGKYVAPSQIENKLGAHGYIEACCVAGNGFPQPFAMLMLSPAAAAKCAEEGGRDAVGSVLAALREQVNTTLDPHERLDRLIVVPDAWTVDNGMVTPTFKVKRAALEARYGAAFEGWAARSETVIWA
mgnify:CR=1 FL=1